MVTACKQQRISRYLALLGTALWLFVCVWCPLTHYQSHQVSGEVSATAITSGDTCSLCVLDALPVCLAESPVTSLPSACQVAPPDPLLLLSSGRLLVPTDATRGPPACFS